MKKIFLLISLFSIIAISPATANETGWRYWSYYQNTSSTHSWTLAQTGPSVALKDGSVEGWVFTFSNDSIVGKTPTVNPDFKTMCADTKKSSMRIRIGIVIDYGLKSIAPKGEQPHKTISRCLSLTKGATGLDALQKIVKVRQSAQGFICGLNSYPKVECSAEVTYSRNPNA